MKLRRALGWFPLVVVIGEITTYFVLTGAASRTSVLARNDLPLGVVIAVAAVTMCTTGCIIVSKQPRNALGWVFALIPIGFWVKGCSDAVTYYAHYARHDAVAGGIVAAWMSTWDYVPAIATLGVFVPLLFPNGRLPSKRWRPLAVIAPIVVLLAIAVFAFVPGPLDSFKDINNPYAATGTIATILTQMGAGIVLLPLTFVLSALSLVFRARAGSPVVRAQVKWLASALTIFAIAFGVAVFANFGLFDGVVIFGAVTAVPIASAIAITRYRLFEIERLISRTLTYAAVTGALVVVFLAIVLVPPAVIGSKGGAPNSLIALATLLAAALFRPLLRRVQSFVDRRFNRTSYDSERTFNEFSMRLRDEIDIDTLRSELCDVVARSMQPASVGVWLRTR